MNQSMMNEIAAMGKGDEKDKENEEIELVKVDDFVATGMDPENLKGGTA